MLLVSEDIFVNCWTRVRPAGANAWSGIHLAQWLLAALAGNLPCLTVGYSRAQGFFYESSAVLWAEQLCLWDQSTEPPKPHSPVLWQKTEATLKGQSKSNKDGEAAFLALPKLLLSYF